MPPLSPTVAAASPAGAGLPRAAFRRAILAWYASAGRELPFRGTRDPYAILVSETMAQQTQIERVGPAWEQFLAAFPTFEALAAASPADVQRAWQGLGYNRRALNLQRTARRVVEDHGGRLPRDVARLESLPGIGPYTARAVVAIAFDRRVGAVDTNVRRVLGRVVAGGEGLRPAELQQLADSLVPPRGAARWTHALMDLGATFCRPRPSCASCPARRFCSFAAGGSAGPSRPGPSDRVTGSAVRARGSAVRARGSAARGSPLSAPSRARGPFESTTRWLRGRILDRCRAAADPGWAAFDGPIGTHELRAVRAMLATLQREGLLELDADDPGLARIPVELPPRLPPADRVGRRGAGRHRAGRGSSAISASAAVSGHGPGPGALL